MERLVCPVCRAIRTTAPRWTEEPCGDCRGQGWRAVSGVDGFEQGARRYSYRVPCTSCLGSGRRERWRLETTEPPARRQACPLCRGGGCAQCDRTGQVIVQHEVVGCRTCGGTGTVRGPIIGHYRSGEAKHALNACPTCGGARRQLEERYLPDHDSYVPL
jgi:DnaJ-class molecular chaperone